MLSVLPKKSAGNRGLAMLLAGLFAFAALAAVPIAAKADAVSQTVPVGVNPISMAVNPVTNKIYIANGGSNTVSIINGATNAVATAPTGNGPCAIAVNTVTNKIYVTNQIGNSVTVIDGATDTAESAIIQTGTQPGAIAVNPATNMIYTANEYTVTVIDGSTNTVVSTIPMTFSARAIAVNPATNRAYVTDTTAGLVFVIDCNTNTVMNSITTVQPVSAIAVNPVMNRIYATDINSTAVTVIDGNDNSVAYVTTGSGPVAVVADPLTGKAYTANRNGNSMTVINPDNTSVTVATGTAPSSVAVNSAASKIYVANYSSSNVTVIDGVTNAVFATVAVGTNPNMVAVNPLTGKVYVANPGSDNVTVIDGDSNSCTTVPTGALPGEGAVNPVTGKLYVTNPQSNTVTVIDGDTNATATVLVGEEPRDVAVNPVTNKVYVSNSKGNTVTVIDGATNTTATLAVGNSPYMVEVNPATNRIYVVNQGASNSVSVIDGASGTVVSTLQFNSRPDMIAVNPVTNMVYVAMPDMDKVMAIDGATNKFTEIPVTTYPNFIAVNPVTNKIYVTGYFSQEVTVIDGASNNATTINLGVYSLSLAVNTITNKIYVAGYGRITVLDGATNDTDLISSVSNPEHIAINPAMNMLYVIDRYYIIMIDCVSNTPTATLQPSTVAYEIIAHPVNHKIYTENQGINGVTVIDVQNVQPGLLTTAIGTLPHNATSDDTPTFEFTASSAYTPNAPAVSQIWYQVDTMTGPWQKASPSGGSAEATLPALTKGTHVLYAFATDGMEATSINISPANGSIPGAVSAYAFTVVGYQVDLTTANAEFGTVTGGGTYSHAEEVTLHAVPRTGYHFVRWTENGSQVSTNADYAIEVLGPRMLSAEFALNSYTINAAANNEANGTVTGGGTFDHGAPVTLRATPVTGYHFVRWTEGGDEVSTNADYTFTAEKVRTLTAEFAINQYTVNAAVNNTAYGTITGGGIYGHGASVTLRAAASTGCRFLRWAEGVVEISTSADYTFTVDKDRTLTAVFEAVTPDTIPVTVSCSKTDVDKYGASTGSITATAAGGNSGAFLYSADGGATWQASGSFTKLAAGHYTVLARDANNAANVSAIVEVKISQPKLAWTGIASKMPAKVKAGEAWVIKPAAKPSGYTLKSVKYASGNAVIASVDKKGNVTFLKGGRVKLTVTTVFQKGKRLKTVRSVKYVTVTQLVSSITLNKTNAVLKVRKTLKLIPKINPSTATNKKVKWKSSNTKIATVSSSGVVTARKAGTVVITCTADDGSKVKADCTVKVK